MVSNKRICIVEFSCSLNIVLFVKPDTKIDINRTVIGDSVIAHFEHILPQNLDFSNKMRQLGNKSFFHQITSISSLNNLSQNITTGKTSQASTPFTPFTPTTGESPVKLADDQGVSE